MQRAAAQDIVPRQRDQHRVFDIVVERVAVADAFGGYPRDRWHQVHQVGVRRAEPPSHIAAEEFAERIRRQFGNGNHDRLLSLRPAPGQWDRRDMISRLPLRHKAGA